MPVKIHGKDYKTVAERVTEFHNDHSDKNISIVTEIIQFKDDIVVMKAAVKIGDNVFTGHAIEDKTSSKINEYNYIECAETSCIGRALASAGYLGSEFASADELVGALNKQNTPYKAKKEDLSGDGWRDNPIGFKSGKNEGKSYREVDDDTLIWIINQCKVESWKEKAIKEMQLRQDGQQTSVSKKEVDDLFNTNEGDQDAK